MTKPTIKVTLDKANKMLIHESIVEQPVNLLNGDLLGAGRQSFKIVMNKEGTQKMLEDLKKQKSGYELRIANAEDDLAKSKESTLKFSDKEIKEIHAFKDKLERVQEFMQKDKDESRVKGIKDNMKVDKEVLKTIREDLKIMSKVTAESMRYLK